jgi:hypothetical protein
MAAPKGNKFAIGNSGRQKYFENPEQLESFINDYFNYIDDHPIKMWHTQIDRKEGKPIEIEIKRPYTIEGLAVHLEVDRRTLLNYEKTDGYEEFFRIITQAKAKIRQSQIEAALTGVGKEKFTEFLLINNSDYKSTAKIDLNINDKRKQISDLFPDDDELNEEEN